MPGPHRLVRVAVLPFSVCLCASCLCYVLRALRAAQRIRALGPADARQLDASITVHWHCTGPGRPSSVSLRLLRPGAAVLAGVRALEERRVRFVMVSPWLDRKVMGRDWGDRLEPLRAYLGIHYHAVKTFANSEQVLERNE